MLYCLCGLLYMRLLSALKAATVVQPVNCFPPAKNGDAHHIRVCWVLEWLEVMGRNHSARKFLTYSLSLPLFFSSVLKVDFNCFNTSSVSSETHAHRLSYRHTWVSVSEWVRGSERLPGPSLSWGVCSFTQHMQGSYVGRIPDFHTVMSQRVFAIALMIAPAS